jgi:hypothetical protein
MYIHNSKDFKYRKGYFEPNKIMKATSDILKSIVKESQSKNTTNIQQIIVAIEELAKT